jgi:asparagine synthase (glutamine-hydrolysing)
MCGITGFNWKDEKLIIALNKTIKHRGPDDSGYYADEKLSMGNVRLAIIDLSPKGHMPMFSDDNKLIITYNGEIYNYKEIREELIKKGHRFNSRTDTEVILYAYKEWGFDCVKKFNGMWAFAIYDKNKNILFISRDRFGIKPLYYYHNNNNFIFSSEIKAILKCGIKRKANDRIIFDYLYYNLIDHSEETFFYGIKRLMPGHNLIFDLAKNTIRIENYYNLKERLKLKKGIKEDERELKKLFFTSVERRLVSDVPVGSCLSGGIDSSSIVCTMRKLNKKGIIKTFSLTFPNEKIDESKYQKMVIDKAKCFGYFTTPKPEDLLNDLNDFLYAQEEPVGSTTYYAQYRVMRLAHEQGMKVLLDGQGSDEIFAGYTYFFAYYFRELFFRIKFFKFFKEIIKYRKNHKSFFALNYMFFLMLPSFLKNKINFHRRTYLNEKFILEFKNRNTKIKQWSARTLNEALLNSVTYYSLPHLLRTEDKSSMRFSIESRVPFLDYELVEYVLSKGPSFKINHGITKYAFRKAMNGVTPKEILSRMDKIGFATPEENWLKNECVKKMVFKIIESENFRKRKYWNAAKVKKLYIKHLNEKGNYANEIWKCICLEKWFEIFEIKD